MEQSEKESSRNLALNKKSSKWAATDINRTVGGFAKAYKKSVLGIETGRIYKAVNNDYV